MRGLPVTAQSPSTTVMKLKNYKNKDSDDKKGCDLHFDSHQTLESAVDRYNGILKNIPYEYVIFSISVGLNFRCNVPRCRQDHFAVTVI
jgi:hypothetical protein